MIPSYYPPDQSLYGMYVAEREGREIIESDRGFLTYYFFEDSCWIADLYVHPDYRKTGEASKMADKVEVIAKERGCTKLLGSVAPSAKSSTESMKVLLAYGFKIDSCVQNFIALKKDI